MGQNQSYPDGTPASNSGDSENNNSSSSNNNNNNNNNSSSNNNNNNNNNNQTSGSSETSEEASTRDGSEKRGGGGINQAQSVRAAIDTLIESCLVAKDDGMNGETVKAPAVGYTLEQLTMPKEDPESSETSLGSTENKSSTKEKDKEKEKSSDKEESKNSKETRPTTPPKTFGSFMEKSIIELITKGEEEQEELFLIGTKGQKEKSPSEGSVKHIGSVSDRKNSSEQTKSAAGDKTVGKTDSGVKSDPPSTTKPVRTLPKRTVRLQTLIDTVLDNSLAQEMPSAYERRKSEALINDLLISRCDPSLKSVSQTEPVTSKSDMPRPEAKENKMVHLMDHIEKVLEKNLEASCDDSDDDSSHLRILNRLSWESPPMTSSGSTPAASLSSSSSTTSSAHHNDSSPRTKQQQQHQQQHDLQSRASSGSNSSEGTISVQDIVDRVISQTEVISKLLSPGDPASAARAAGKDSGKHTTTTTTSNVIGSCCSSQPICSQAANATKPEQLSRSPQNLHARSPQNQPQSGSHGTEGHSQKSLDHSPRGRPRASTYDSHQMWMLRHAQDSRASVGHPSSEKNSSDFRQLDSSSSSGEGLHNISKNNKSVLSPAFGSGPGPGPGPLVMPPYVNTLASTSGIVSFAQSPVFRPPGHQMFVPRYPVPLLRVEMASDSAQALPPHPPSSSCLCVACVGKFRLDEHSPKHGLLGPVTSTSSSGMLSPHGQMDSSYYQQRMAGAAGQHNPFMMRDYSRPAPNSPGRHGLPSPAQMPGVASKQGVVGQTPKTVHYPPPHVGGFAHDSEFHGFTSYEKQKLEVLKSERGFPSPHLQHVSIQNPFETPHNDSVYNPVDPSFLHSRLEASFQRAEDAARGGKYESLAEKKLHSMSSPAQVAMYDDSRRDRVHGGSPILDLSVKKTGLSRPYSEKPSNSAPVLNEPMDEPLDLSKKTAQPSFTSEHNNKRQELRIQKSESFGFRRPEASVKQEVNNKAHHLDGSPGRYGHSQQRDVHPYPGASPSSSLFSMNARLPRQAEMAPNVNPNMLLSAGGQRPQLHPLPAPSLATSLMPSSTATMLQTYMSHAQAAVLPNHSGDPSADQRSKPQPSSGHATRTGESATHKPQRESPQLDSPDNSPLDKDDVAGRRSCSGRNEPIQSIIGNHNPNDILYLICRICRQSNGSPYAFRKHFRNHHGFEPKAEHTIVQTISATKSARQNPYASNGPGGEGVQFSGNESAEEQRSSLSSSSSSSNSSRKPNFKTESHVSSDSHPADNIPSPNDAGNRHQKSRGRSPAEARQRDAKDSREDTKCLECPECKQTFQLNDFGSYKRHCRQHNQSRGSGSFVACDLSSDPQDAQVEKMQGGITMCKICGVPFSAHYIDDHVRSVHGFFCSQCPEVFKTSDDLQSHLRSAHSNHFLPANAAAAAVANANVHPGSSPSTRMSPRGHSPSRASLPSSSPNLSSSPHPRRSPSRSGHSSSTTPSPGNVSQKSGRDTQSSPGDVVVCVAAASKSSSATAAAAAAAAVPTNRISTSESSGYGSISSTCEIERVPADNLTISASPDSSSDNVNKRSPSLCVLSDITVSSCSLATPDDRSRVTSAKGRGKGDDDMDSTVSGSPTTDMVIDVSTVDGGETQPPNFFYKHKKFGGHRKRAESSDSSEVSANKVAKYGKDDASSAVSGHSVNDDSSSNSSCSSLKGGEQEKADDSGSVTKEQTITAKPKVENKLKQEARHQLPFVWDRVTRIQAGKNIKPPDYMT